MVEQFVLQDIVLEDVAKSAEDDNRWDDWKIEECGNEHDEVVRELVRHIEHRLLKLLVRFQLRHVQYLTIFVFLQATETFTLGK